MILWRSLPTTTRTLLRRFQCRGLSCVGGPSAQSQPSFPRATKASVQILNSQRFFKPHDLPRSTHHCSSTTPTLLRCNWSPPGQVIYVYLHQSKLETEKKLPTRAMLHGCIIQQEHKRRSAASSRDNARLQLAAFSTALMTACSHARRVLVGFG